MKTIILLVVCIASSGVAQFPKAKIGWSRQQFDKEYVRYLKEEASDSMVIIDKFKAWNRAGRFAAVFSEDTLRYWAWGTTDLKGKIVKEITTSMNRAGYATTSFYDNEDDKLYYIPKKAGLDDPAYKLVLDEYDESIAISHGRVAAIMPD